ncbi:MAG: type II toxin-antitoxin system VapC family toxin [Gemmatimonadales bacterium]
MIVYAESSAILAWLLGEPAAADVRRILNGAERVVTSSLTAIECARGLARARAAGRITSRDELAALRLLDVAEGNWDVLQITERVVARARGTFPVEPVRTLDAIHLATAGLAMEAVGAVAALSLDDRIRENFERLGFPGALERGAAAPKNRAGPTRRPGPR